MYWKRTGKGVGGGSEAEKLLGAWVIQRAERQAAARKPQHQHAVERLRRLVRKLGLVDDDAVQRRLLLALALRRDGVDVDGLLPRGHLGLDVSRHPLAVPLQVVDHVGHLRPWFVKHCRTAVPAGAQLARGTLAVGGLGGFSLEKVLPDIMRWAAALLVATLGGARGSLCGCRH